MPAIFPAILPKYQALYAGPSTGGAYSPTPAGGRLAFTRFAPNCTTEYFDSTAGKATGTRTHFLSGVVPNLRRVRPQMSLMPTPAEWSVVLPWAMCSAAAGSGSGSQTYALGERELTRDVAFNDAARVWTMTDVAVGRAVLAAAQGGPLTADLECNGSDFNTTLPFPTGAGTAFVPGPPFMMIDASILVGNTTAVRVQSAQVVIDNGLLTDRFFFGATGSGSVAGDRTIAVTLVMPYGLHSALWNAGAGSAGCAVVLAFARGASTLTLTMPAVRAVEPAPESVVPSEVFMPWVGQAFSDTAGAELTASLVSPSV